MRTTPAVRAELEESTRYVLAVACGCVLLTLGVAALTAADDGASISVGAAAWCACGGGRNDTPPPPSALVRCAAGAAALFPLLRGAPTRGASHLRSGFAWTLADGRWTRRHEDGAFWRLSPACETGRECYASCAPPLL